MEHTAPMVVYQEILAGARGFVVCDGAGRGTPKAGARKKERKTKRLGVRGKSRDWEAERASGSYERSVRIRGRYWGYDAVIKSTKSKINQSTHAANHRIRTTSEIAAQIPFQLSALGVGFFLLEGSSMGTSPLEPPNGLASHIRERDLDQVDAHDAKMPSGGNGGKPPRATEGVGPSSRGPPPNRPCRRRRGTRVRRPGASRRIPARTAGARAAWTSRTSRARARCRRRPRVRPRAERRRPRGAPSQFANPPSRPSRARGPSPSSSAPWCTSRRARSRWATSSSRTTSS